jgi:hypothetical protein
MKTLFKSTLMLLGITLVLTSCGINLALFNCKSPTITTVNLESNNYKVIGRVSGTSTMTYYLGVGGMKNTQIVENATNDMLAKANLNEGSRALVNQVVDIHKGGIPFFYSKITVTVSANVIEFTR